MRLTVLGSCGAWPEAGRACSGFLVEHDGARVVLDLGFGTMPRLQAHCPDGRLDAVVITHEHSDHCVDLNALYRQRLFTKAPRIPLFCTDGVVERIGRLEPRGELGEVFGRRELPARIGPFELSAVELEHHVRNVGIRLTAAGRTLAYTGDTGPCDALATLGRNADLFIVEATVDQPRQHLMTSTQAAGWARRAGARRLMLTHFWPGSDRAAAAAAAANVFGGEVITADEDLTMTL